MARSLFYALFLMILGTVFLFSGEHEEFMTCTVGVFVILSVFSMHQEERDQR